MVFNKFANQHLEFLKFLLSKAFSDLHQKNCSTRCGRLKLTLKKGLRNLVLSELKRK